MIIAIINPHTDDGELGMGATINRLVREGNELHYIAFSSAGNKILEDEMKKAMDVLGVTNIYTYNYEARTFDSRRQEILQNLIDFKKSINPDLIFCPSINDLHQDHTVVTQEVIRCFKTKNVLSYELPWNNISFRSDFYFEITETDLAQKITALSCYKTQKNRDYFIRKEALFTGLAIKHGIEMGVKYAEAFEQIRWMVAIK